ncbi:cytokine receptor family member b2 [Corythoichthys intestinalis]|uniref:cytokine receptor family member b2 n=1 Tax=Corythoichthys intestinalis TaxID=161448 RepID=UPI0025A4EEB7|nr:cytokine receptor family member b2 [Corythoichthys intestinalis]
MLFVFLVLTSLPQVLTALSELPQPVNVTISSMNFIHKLTWEPGLGTPADVVYQISTNTDVGTTWDPVSGCQHVQYPLVCNMTEAFSDPLQVYLTQVTVKQKARASRPFTLPGFQPIKDTQLDLPVVTVTPCEKNLCVDLLPQTLRLWEVYNSLSYQLMIDSSDADRPPFFQEIKSLKRSVLKNLTPGRRYCISVRFSDSLIPRESDYGRPSCAIIPGIYPTDFLITPVLCIFAIVGIIMMSLLVYTGFLCPGESLPSVLKSFHHTKEVRVIVPHKAPLASLQIIPTLPSSCESDCQTSALEDEESSSESAYEMRLPCNVLSSSPSSSPLLPSLSQHEPLPSDIPCSNSGIFSGGVFSPQTQASFEGLNATSVHSTTIPAPISDHIFNSDHRPVSVQAAEGIKPNEMERWVVRKWDDPNVNLHSLILGRFVEEEETAILDQSNTDTMDLQEHDSTSDTANEDEEEQQDEQSSYMPHPFSFSS